MNKNLELNEQKKLQEKSILPSCCCLHGRSLACHHSSQPGVISKLADSHFIASSKSLRNIIIYNISVALMQEVFSGIYV